MKWLRLHLPRLLRRHLADALAFLGLVCLVHGSALIWRPLGWMVAGLLLLLTALHLATLERARRQSAAGDSSL